MKKMAALSLILLVVAALSGPQFVSADEAAATGAAQKGAYTIKQGDTLWGISGSYLRDPFLWKEIWKQNPCIKDPDLIFPGEQLVIPGITGEALQAGGTAPAKKAGPTAGPLAAPSTGPAAGPYARGTGREEPFVNMGKTIVRAPEKKEIVQGIEEVKPPKSPIADESGILEAGFIFPDRDKDKASSVAGTPRNDDDVFSTGDEVYIGARDEYKPGDRMVIFRPIDNVDDPGTGKGLGTAVKITGLLQLKERRDRFFLAVIDQALLEVKIDDLLLPFPRPEPVYEPVPKNPALRGMWGYVSATKDDLTIGSLGAVLYLDMGSDAGVKPGDRFLVRRSGGTTTIPDDEHHYIVPKDYIMPDIKVGEVQVISVQSGTSTALVTDFSEPIRIGYRVYYKD